MKKIVLFLSLLVSAVSFAQSIQFEVRGLYTRSIKKTQLADVQTLRDIIADYPVNWIDEYEGVEISAVNNGVSVIGFSENEILTKEQKTMLRKADMASEVVIKVRFKNRNAVTQLYRHNDMNITYTVVPEEQAEFPGGHLKMTEYFQKNIMGKIPAKLPKDLQTAEVRFTIDERGGVRDVVIKQSSGNDKADQQIIREIEKMPNWIPAQNASGEKIKQQFQFRLGKLFEGC